MIKYNIMAKGYFTIFATISDHMWKNFRQILNPEI